MEDNPYVSSNKYYGFRLLRPEDLVGPPWVKAMTHPIPEDASFDFLEEILEGVLHYLSDEINLLATLRLGSKEQRHVRLSELCQSVNVRIEEVGQRLMDAFERLCKEHAEACADRNRRPPPEV